MARNATSVKNDRTREMLLQILQNSPSGHELDSHDVAARISTRNRYVSPHTVGLLLRELKGTHIEKTGDCRWVKL